ncbi:MAG: hypothetical protein GX567_11395 [Clostridia bacterium]|nr:hypothetical protein [Clostridia bacterium]
MSNNLVKGGFVTYNADTEARVIDSNKLIEEKIQNLMRNVEQAKTVEFNENFTVGLEADQVEQLLNDEDSQDTASMAHAAAAEEMLKDAQIKADQMINDAKSQAEEIIRQANEQAASVREEAYKEGYQEGNGTGYTEGLQKNAQMERQLNERAKELETEYEEKLSTLEPLFVDTLTEIYEHVFHIRFGENKDIVFFLLQDAIRKIEGSKDFLVHISKEDYGYVSMQKKELLSGIGHTGNVEIIEDVTLEPGQCMIETGGGIFDCGIGTQLAGLTKELKLLSYTKE